MAALSSRSETKTREKRDGRTRPKTRERILEAATVVFSEKGYYQAAVDDIVEASNTSKGSFYNFFPSKEGIFLALVDRLHGVLINRVEKAIAKETGALAKVDAALTAALEDFSRHRRIARILLIEAAGLGHSFNAKLIELHTAFAKLIQSHLDRAVEEGSIPPLDTELAAYAWLGAINEVVIRWLHTGQPNDLKDALPELRSLLLRSIGAPLNERGSSLP